MPYATIIDMTRRYGRDELVKLTDRSRSGAINEAVVAEELENASAIIDGFVGARYSLPLPSVPSVLNAICMDMTHAYLHRTTMPELIAARQKQALALLGQISRGLLKLDVGDGDAPPADRSGLAVADGPERVFTSERLRGL